MQCVAVAYICQFCFALTQCFHLLSIDTDCEFHPIKFERGQLSSASVLDTASECRRWSRSLRSVRHHENFRPCKSGTPAPAARQEGKKRTCVRRKRVQAVRRFVRALTTGIACGRSSPMFFIHHSSNCSYVTCTRISNCHAELWFLLP